MTENIAEHGAETSHAPGAYQPCKNSIGARRRAALCFYQRRRTVQRPKPETRSMTVADTCALFALAVLFIGIPYVVYYATR